MLHIGLQNRKNLQLRRAAAEGDYNEVMRIMGGASNLLF